MKSSKNSSSSTASGDNASRKASAGNEGATANAGQRTVSKSRDAASTGGASSRYSASDREQDRNEGQSGQSLSASNTPARSSDYYHGFHEGFHHGAGNRQSRGYNSQGQRETGRYGGYNENDTGYDAGQRSRYDDNVQDYRRAEGEVRRGTQNDDRGGWQRSGGTSENPDYDRDQERYAGEERYRNAADAARRSSEGSYYRAADDRYEREMSRGDDYEQRDERSSDPYRSSSKSNRGGARNR